MTPKPLRDLWWLKCILLLSVTLSCVRPVTAQDDFDDEPPEFLPGLIGVVELPTGERIEQLADDIVFDWSNSSVDGRANPDASFKVRWNGFLECKENGSFKLHSFVAGRVRIQVDEREILSGESNEPRWLESQPVELKFGRHAIEVEYETTQSASHSRQLGLYWSGPQFQLEPIPHRSFSHRASNQHTDLYGRGNELSRALRCTACHTGNDAREHLTAPSLTHLQDNLNRDWLVNRLTSTEHDPSQRMPHFGLSPEDASAIADALFDESQAAAAIKAYVKPKVNKPKKDEPAPRDPSNEEGRTAFLSRGCLACHQLGELGEQSLFDGGDLSAIAKKRTQNFFVRWLENPAATNAQHRMPQFDLQPLERADLAMFLQSLGKVESASLAKTSDTNELERGKALIVAHRCGACHELPTNLRSEQKRTEIGSASDWERSCLAKADPIRKKPGFQLPAADIGSLRIFWLNSNREAIAKNVGKRVLVEQNCVRCHARDAETGLAKSLAKLATAEPTLATQLAALSPPSLTGVGDKLHEKTIAEILAGTAKQRRPWLAVQMPKFRLTEHESQSVIEEVVAHDRIPALPNVAPKLPSGKATELAAARLVTSDGFGCQSCHKIGSAEPPKVAINAHGTDLTMLGDRVRQSWFKRWIHNPSRIVPRMEMPAIQVAAKGVLNDDLELQLEALWQTLNTQGFEPPKPNAVRVVRNFNVDNLREHAHVLADVLESPSRKYLRPLTVGLPNRHNVLFDLETGQLASWWIGDTARQYTRGKSWYWEAGAPPLVENADWLQKFSIVDSSNRVWRPATLEQFVVQFDSLTHIEGGIEWRGRVELRSDNQSQMIRLIQRIVAAGDSQVEVTTRLEQLDRFGANCTLVIEAPTGARIDLQDSKITSQLNETASATWTSPRQMNIADGAIKISDVGAGSSVEWSLGLATNLAADRFQPLNVPVAASPQAKLDVVPGFTAVQLPLPRDEMPTAIAWRGSGEMFIASLKGRVLQVIDTDQDDLGDRFEIVSDDLPAPYGLAVNSDSVDVLCKTSLIRLKRDERQSAESNVAVPNNQQVVADGWGYTADYHDWAVGLVREPDGSYFIALPCQQDDRTPAAAKLRGQALKLIPYQSEESSRAYRIETVAAGLRFPMGLALSRSGDLFATDNQGNYNPFNELNHLQFGKRYGFINKLEAKPGFAPEFESPSVNLPHPWTRSVNGLCFLDTPAALSDGGQRKSFGPFEGDLIGCEYNGLSLIRMSLQKVNGQYQGAAYLFSRPPVDGEATFEGPVCCAISPRGELYVGSIHDSGWGGGQNTGSIVRLQADREMPLGIDEVRATRRLASKSLSLSPLTLREPQKRTATRFVRIVGFQRPLMEATTRTAATKRCAS